MKKQTAISILVLLTLFMGAASVSAQTTVQADASADINTGGGLGKGISHMVRNILGDTDDSSDVSAQSAAIAPQAALMMQAKTAPIPAPAARMAPIAAPRATDMNTFSAEAAVPATLTDDALHAYVTELLHEDSRIQSIDTADTHVRMTYVIPSTVFRVMHVRLKVTVGAYASGGTEVTYPWYAFAASGVSSDFKARITDRVEPMITSASFSPDQQKMLIDEIHLSLTDEFGTSTGADR